MTQERVDAVIGGLIGSTITGIIIAKLIVDWLKK